MASNSRKIKEDPISQLRSQVKTEIYKQYSTVEKFCYENGFQKSTLSRFLNGERLEYKISTLVQITEALGLKLVIKAV